MPSKSVSWQNTTTSIAISKYTAVTDHISYTEYLKKRNQTMGYGLVNDESDFENKNPFMNVYPLYYLSINQYQGWS
jgi:hypothetical protein